MNIEIQTGHHVKWTGEECRGLEEANQPELYYTYAWKQHKHTPCVGVFISNQQNIMLSCFLFYLLCVLFYKIKGQESGTGSAGGVGLAQVGVGKRMNTVQPMCTHVCNCKNDTC
jgi:hypothetical protein